MNGVRFLCLYQASMPVNDVLKAVDALATVVGTEDFSTYRTRYVTREEDVDTLVEFRSCCLTKFQDDFATRRTVRPLLDCILQMSRQYNMK